jgi:lipoyl(octanoyl) transferase
MTATKDFRRGISYSYALFNAGTTSCKRIHPNKQSATVLRHLNFTKSLPYSKGQQIQEQFKDANVQFKHMMSKIASKRREMLQKKLIMNDYEVELLANIISMKPSPTLLTFQFQPVITGGRREKNRLTQTDISLLESLGYDFVQTNRGGEITFHNEGQLVIYPILDLQDFDHLTIRCFVSKLEDAIINTLAKFGVKSQKTQNTGVWVDENTKISSIGLSVSRSVTSHGISINVCNEIPDIERAGFMFCGLPGKGQTSMRIQTGKDISVADVSKELSRQLAKILGIETIESVDLDDLEIH